MTEPSGSGGNVSQNQTVYFTSVSNAGGTYTIGINNGLYLPNWAYPQTPILSWQGPGSYVIGEGLEDMTLYVSGTLSSNGIVQFTNAYASWVEGVRFIGSGTSTTLQISSIVNCLIMNNYFFPDVAIDSNYPPAMITSNITANLILNNMMMSESEPVEKYGGNSGNVVAYNFARDSFTLYPFNVSYDHHAFDGMELLEGNEYGGLLEDDTWGTHGLNTYFRNMVPCYDSPYTTYQVQNSRGFQLDSYQRFMNVIGNAFGTSSQCGSYSSTSTIHGHIFALIAIDSLSSASLMRWGNVSVVQQSSDTPSNSGIRFVSSEVPASLSGNAAPFQNSVPANNGLPCSFYFSGHSSSPCSILTSGGTGFSWWQVCVSWTTFPTSCASTQLQPFPVAGPEQSGGPYVNGHGYDVPAAVAWKNLPVDTTYQKSYTIAGSNWSAGTETLTFSSSVLPNTTHLMGPFQLSGVSAACTSGATFNSSNEILMTGSTSTTITYALASNPGVLCTGTFKFPDVRQFDERVYEMDSSATPAPPTNPLAASH
jgi:hypothetical protein